MTTRLEPRIYVASLSDYNAGRLHGVWIDATLGVEHIEEETAKMLRASPESVAEEWAIHDYIDFGDLRLGEYEDLKTVAAYAEALAEHGAAFAAWVDHQPSYNTDPDRFADEYIGEFDSEEDYAAEYAHGLLPVDIGKALNVPSHWVTINYEAIWDEMHSDGYYSMPSPDYKVYIFAPAS